MIRSLRSLCLLKVWKEEINYEALPLGVVRDLNMMQWFNGSFSSKRDYEDSEGEEVLEASALSILYDGVSWTFNDRSELFSIHCCYDCSDVCQPDLYQLTATEEELVTAVPPFCQVRQWFQREEESYGEPFKQLDITISVEIGGDELSGKIRFHGTGDLVSFDVMVKVELNSAGSRVMTHQGTAISGSVIMRMFVDTLEETTGYY